MSKTNLTKEKLICDLYAMNFHMGEWGRHLVMEQNFTVDEVLAVMQRMVKYVKDK